MMEQKRVCVATIRQVVCEMAFLAVPLVALKFFLMETPVMSIVIGLNLLARFILMRRKGDWIFFLIGLICGGGNDLLSMIRGVYFYTPPTILPAPIPIWMLFFWGHIFTAFRQLFMLKQFIGPEPVGSPWKIDKRLIADVITFAILRWIIYSFVQQEPIPAVGYASVVILRIALVPPSLREIKLMAVVVPLGIFYEAALIHLGLYIYHDPVFLGMPAWLMIYWAFMLPLFVKGIFERIEYTIADRGAAGD